MEIHLTPRQRRALDKQHTVHMLLAQGYNQSGVARLLGISRQRVNSIVNAEKNYARDLLNKAIKRGRVKRSAICESCSTEVLTQGHHDDYSKPYTVIWLCQKCHTARHLGQERNYNVQANMQKDLESMF